MTRCAPGTVKVISTAGQPPSSTASAMRVAASADSARTTATSPASVMRLSMSSLGIIRSRPSVEASAHAEQDVHRQLVEPLVPQPLRGQLRAVEVLREEFGRLTLLELGRAAVAVRGRDLGEYLLDLGVAVPTLALLLQDEVRPHAPAREVLDAFVVFSPV